MIYEVRKEFRGGRWVMHARLPKGTELANEYVRAQLHEWGEGTNGGHEEGYRMYITDVKKAPEDTKWLEFNKKYLAGSPSGAGKAKAGRSSRPRGRTRASVVATAAESVPAGTVITTPKLDGANTSKMTAALFPVPFMPPSSPAILCSGSSLPPSAPAVAPPSTGIEPTFCGLDPSFGTVASLAAMLIGLLDMTMSGDKVALASHAARKMALRFGVSLEDFEKVRGVVVEKWLDIEGRNPLHRALGAGGDPNG